MARVTDMTEAAIRARSARWVRLYGEHADNSGARQPAQDRARLIEILDQARAELAACNGCRPR